MTKFKGGEKLQKLAKNAKGGVVSYAVGFFPQAKYADGIPVASVGLWNEFGTRDSAGNVLIPERSFFRSTTKEVRKKIRKLVIKLRNPQTKVMDKRAAGKIAAFHAGAIQDKIISVKKPPNKPQTVSRKGSNNPLVDTGLMVQSVTWDVDDGRQ